MAEAPVLHATLIAHRVRGAWWGALVRGPSGAGKSDLALRAMAAGWRLVADDRVRIWRSAGSLYGAAPAPLAGLVEARGVGIMAAPALAFARIGLVVDACGPDRTVERMPEPAHDRLLGLDLATLRLPLLEASCVVKLELALGAAAAALI